MRCPPGARLALSLALAFAAAPAARADGPLGPGAPCETLQHVTDSMSFAAGFPVAKGCEKLCKKARATCAKHVNRAVSCNRKSIDDSSFFQVKVTCAGEKGSALKMCSAPLDADKKAAREALDGERETALATCDQDAQTCAGHCNGTP